MVIQAEKTKGQKRVERGVNVNHEIAFYVNGGEQSNLKFWIFLPRCRPL
jgi:hypothetical protein